MRAEFGKQGDLPSPAIWKSSANVMILENNIKRFTVLRLTHVCSVQPSLF